MKLDYQITELIHPQRVDGTCIYNHVNWTVWIHNKELLEDVNKTFDYSFELNKKNEVNEEVAYAVWHYIENKRNYIGTFGTEYDKNILDI